MDNIQGVGESFNLQTYLDTRNKTISAVQKVASQIEVGMNEEDGFRIIDEVLEDFGLEKKWHPNKFRIGINTLKAFREKSEPDIQLQKDDLFFIDIGPVFNGHEGDYGETFVVGDNTDHLLIKDKVKEIFQMGSRFWKSKSPTGIELYEELVLISRSCGYELNLKMIGHRLSDFPHAIHYKGKLGETDLVPMENIWILEVLIRHPDLEFGAFFEDIIQAPMLDT